MKSEKGKENRTRILAELIKEPQTFGKLKKTLKLTAKTLSDHLKALQKDGLLKREIQGKHILYTLNKLRTILEIRKDILIKLIELLRFDSCLDDTTRNLFYQTFKALQKSIEKPEEGIEKKQVFIKTIKILKGFKGTISQNITNMYEKTELKKQQFFLNHPKEPESMSDRRFYGKQRQRK